MVEIGKRDFIGQGRLAMDLFEPNRSFFGLDLAHMYIERPNKIKKCVFPDHTFQAIPPHLSPKLVLTCA